MTRSTMIQRGRMRQRIRSHCRLGTIGVVCVLACLVGAGEVASPPVPAGASSTKPPINVLTYGDITGLAPISLTYLQDGVAAAVKAFNAAGGVQGRKVNLITCDTKYDAAVAANCVAKAAREGIVFAIPSLELLDNVTTPLLEAQHIPILGSQPSTDAAEYSKTSACFLNSPFVVYPDAISNLAKQGAKKISALEPTGVADENVLNSALKIAAQQNGAKLTGVSTISTTATDFSSIAAQALSNGEDGSYVLATPPGLFTILSSMTQSNPNVKLASSGIVLQNPIVLDGMASIKGLKSVYLNNETAWPNSTNVPGIKLYRNQISAVNPADLPYEFSLFTWTDAWGAMQILSTIKSGPISPSTVTSAMMRAHVKFQGVAPNWSYKYNTLGLGCVIGNYAFTGTYTGGQKSITPTNNSKPTMGVLSKAVISYYKRALATAG
jgi:ABC-type branched-subunit amino acid transport system substrate-binding protein